MSNDNFVHIRWLPEDVKILHPDWTYEKCADALRTVSRPLVDASIESGWEILDVLLQDISD